jgi:flavorubredoxin
VACRGAAGDGGARPRRLRHLAHRRGGSAAAALGDGEWLDLGGKEVQRIDTPHVPHSWDAGLLYEKTTGTLFCSDLFTHLGDPPALTDGDIVGPAIAAEERFHFTSLTPDTGATMRRLAALEPRRLAVMHGSSYSGPVAPALEALAGYYDDKLRHSLRANLSPAQEEL